MGGGQYLLFFRLLTLNVYMGRKQFPYFSKKPSDWEKNQGFSIADYCVLLQTYKFEFSKVWQKKQPIFVFISLEQDTVD